MATTNQLRAQELEETRRNNSKRHELEEKKQELERRGQNMRFASDVVGRLGAFIPKGSKIGPINFRMPKRNDWQWYARSEEVARDIASLSYGYRTGIPYNMPGDNMAGLPGIINLYTLPTIGVSDSAYNGVNIAARQIYSWVRHQNSGSANYEAVDLMLYLVSLGNIYAGYGFCSKVLALSQTYSTENAYIPKGLLQSIGMSLDDVIANIPKLRAWLNNFGERISKAFAAPSNLTYFQRMLFIYSHVWTDAKDGDYGQLYQMVPYGLHRYDEVNGGTSVAPLPTSLNVTSLINYMEGLFTGLARLETANIMSGDIRKAYGVSSLFVFPTFNDSYQMSIEYDEFVLDQFRNATVVGFPVDGVSWGGLNMTQDSGSLIFAPYRKLPNTASIQARDDINADCVSRLITTTDPKPDYRHTLEATRLHLRLRPAIQVNVGDSTEYRAYVDTCGTEIVISARVFVVDGFDSMLDYALERLGFDESTFATRFFTTVLKNFKYSPCVDMRTMSAGSTIGESKYTRFMNVDKWTILDTLTLQTMNDSIMMDMFANRQ